MTPRTLCSPLGKHFSKASFFLLFLTLTTVCLLSQTITTGDITGVVSDASGAVVAGASVTLKSLDTGETHTDKTNSSGVYRFATLRPGNYQISAKTAGLQSDDLNVSVGVGQVARVDITAKV